MSCKHCKIYHKELDSVHCLSSTLFLNRSVVIQQFPQFRSRSFLLLYCRIKLQLKLYKWKISARKSATEKNVFTENFVILKENSFNSSQYCSPHSYFLENSGNMRLSCANFQVLLNQQARSRWGSVFLFNGVFFREACVYLWSKLGDFLIISILLFCSISDSVLI